MNRRAAESQIDWLIAPDGSHESVVHAALEDATPAGGVGGDAPFWRLESATQRRSVFDARFDERLHRLVRYAAGGAAADAVNAWITRALAAEDHQTIIAAGAWKPIGGEPEVGGFLLWSFPPDAVLLKRRLSSPDLSPDHREAAARSIFTMVEDLRDAGLAGLSAAIRTALVDLACGRVLLWETDLLHVPEDDSQRRRDLGRDQRAAARLAARLLAPTGRSIEDLGVL